MKLKWLITSVLALTTLFAVSANAQDKVFSDVDFSTTQGQAIEKMYNAGYLAGYNDGTFKPNATITRAELTRVFNQVFGYTLNNQVETKEFTDVEKGVWYYNDVKIAQSNGYINGFNDGTFKPQDNFTRQQTCVVLSLAAGLKNTDNNITISDEVAPWAENYVKAAISDGAFSLENGNKFRGTVNITRGEVCQALAKYVKTNTESTTKLANTTTKTADKTTEATTSSAVTTTKSTSSGGSSGGSSNNSSGNVTTTTEATTETTTTSNNGGNNNNSTTTTEATTEATTEIVLDDTARKALKSVINVTKYVLVYNVKTDNEREIANYILNTMEAYYADSSYDIQSAISDAKSMYYNLSAEERADFKNCLYSSYNLSDVQILKEIFLPLLS